MALNQGTLDGLINSATRGEKIDNAKLAAALSAISNKLFGVGEATSSLIEAAIAAGGFVQGPPLSLDNEVALYSGVTGKLIKQSGFLGPDVARKSVNNNFTARQAFKGPGKMQVDIFDSAGGAWLQMQNSGAAANVKRWYFLVSNDPAKLDIGTIDDTESFPVAILTLSNAGLVSLNNGQLSFPATQQASTNANTLDDYEEGTWTPVIGGAGGNGSQSYSVQMGSYVKIGQFVYASFNVTLSNKGAGITGALQIQGLPFTVLSVTNYFPPVFINYWTSAGIALSGMGGYCSGTVCNVYGVAAAATSVSAGDNTWINNTTQFLGAAAYRASA